MDGFNVIPVDRESSVPRDAQTLPKQPTISDANFEVVDEAKEREKEMKAESGGWIFWLAILSLFSSCGYFGFLVFERISMLSDIEALGNQMRTVGQNIDKNEMREFQNMDTTLNTINSRLQKHILNFQIMNVVNSNLRSSVQLSEYRIDVKDKEIEVNLSAAVPSFKDLAEQTERFFVMRNSGVITSFSVSNLSFDQETRKMRFNMRMTFDKSKVNAAALNQATQNAEDTSLPVQVPESTGTTSVPTSN